VPDFAAGDTKELEMTQCFAYRYVPRRAREFFLSPLILQHQEMLGRSSGLIWPAVLGIANRESPHRFENGYRCRLMAVH
jgi:hypothetical protein